MPPEPSQLLDPPLNRAAYADRSAWIMARCSELAYVQFENGQQQEQQLRDSLKEIRLELSSTFQREATRGFVAKNSRYAVLAFRGTEKDWRNILTDIRVRFYRDRTGAKIATGFSEAFALVEKDVKDALAQIDSALPLYVTGHSLGGALAAVATMRIVPSDRIAACYTFGCPRVGDGEFALQLWKVPVYRVVHASDIVPRVPPPLGYCHTGDLRYIKRSGQLLKSPGSLGLNLALAYTFITNWRRVFANHRIADYVANLQAWAVARFQLENAPSPAPVPAPSSLPAKTFAATGGTGSR